jgi:hypothetical protein
MRKKNQNKIAAFIALVLAAALLPGVAMAQVQQEEVWNHFKSTKRDVPKQAFEGRQTISNDAATEVWFATGLGPLYIDWRITKQARSLRLGKKLPPGVLPDVVFDKLRAGRRPVRVYVLKATMNEGDGDKEVLIVLRFYEDGQALETHIKNLGTAYDDYEPPKKSLQEKGTDVLKGGWNKLKKLPKPKP